MMTPEERANYIAATNDLSAVWAETLKVFCDNCRKNGFSPKTSENLTELFFAFLIQLVRNPIPDPANKSASLFHDLLQMSS